MFRIYEEENYDAMSRQAANIISAQIILKPNCVLGLATGSTPVGTYKQLVEWYKKGDLDFSEVTTVNLDEYRGLAPTHDQSYRYFMEDNLFSHVNIRSEHTHVPDGLAADPGKACAEYDAMVKALGGTDMQLLGVGRNGHIGFNEPGEAFVVPTHVVDLTQSTLEANARFFDNADDVPRQAMTMGIGIIMAAKKVLLMASGADKADALRDALCGPVTAEVPCSILQLHPDVTLVGDKAALSKLPKKGV